MEMERETVRPEILDSAELLVGATHTGKIIACLLRLYNCRGNPLHPSLSLRRANSAQLTGASSNWVHEQFTLIR